MLEMIVQDVIVCMCVLYYFSPARPGCGHMAAVFKTTCRSCSASFLQAGSYTSTWLRFKRDTAFLYWLCNLLPPRIKLRNCSFIAPDNQTSQAFTGEKVKSTITEGVTTITKGVATITEGVTTSRTLVRPNGDLKCSVALLPVRWPDLITW